MLIYLVGYMGCGKSTIGRALARRMGVEFNDTDSIIEQAEGMSVADVFKTKGEAYFRNVESAAIAEIARKGGNAVVATGGGAPCFLNNMQVMNSSGVSIYLSNTPEKLAARLENGKAKRPLIKDLSQQELVDFIGKALIQRESYYNQATLIIDCQGISDDYVASHIKMYIENHPENR